MDRESGMNEQKEAFKQAEAIRQYWKDRGYIIYVKAVLKVDHGVSAWGIESDLVNGRPRGYRG